MEVTKSGVGASRDSRRLLKGLVNAIGSLRVARNVNRTSMSTARHASWIADPGIESEILAHFELMKSRALYYNAHTQVR